MAAAAAALKEGRSALDAVESGIRPVEADPSVPHVGRGGAPNILGEMECDAAIMNGADLNAGSVGALKGFLHAISVARKVMEKIPHVMLVGDGAARFAREQGEEPADMLTDKARADYRGHLEKNVPADVLLRWPRADLGEYVQAPPKSEPRGTTVFLAIDKRSNLAAGTSTSGWGYKYPGRLGDSPIIGAGLYADNRYGACACTHTGEMTIRAGTAVSVVRYMQKGASAQDACHEAMTDLRQLQNGYLGPVVVHVVDRNGSPHVVSTAKDNSGHSYWFWCDESDRIQCRDVERVST
jgi:L-asparaginase